MIRLPFKWERIQRKLYGELNREEMDYIKFLLAEADKRDMQILIDMHNYGRRKDDGKDRIIGDSLSIDHFALAWGSISRELKDCKGLYGYGLINEPHDMLASTPWVGIAQAAIDSIRKNDAKNAIVVGGNHWSSAERWKLVSDDLKNLRDPSRNLIFEAHCYFDEDGSGIYRRSYEEEKAHPYIGVERMRPFVEWLKENDFRGLVGEYGVPADDELWLECLDNFLAYLSAEGVNGTYWADAPLPSQPSFAVPKRPCLHSVRSVRKLRSIRRNTSGANIYGVVLHCRTHKSEKRTKKCVQKQ